MKYALIRFLILSAIAFTGTKYASAATSGKIWLDCVSREDKSQVTFAVPDIAGQITMESEGRQYPGRYNNRLAKGYADKLYEWIEIVDYETEFEPAGTDPATHAPVPGYNGELTDKKVGDKLVLDANPGNAGRVYLDCVVKNPYRR